MPVLDLAQSLGLGAISLVLTTHRHHDHSGGNIEMRERAAQAGRPDIVVAASSRDVPGVTRVVGDGGHVDLGLQRRVLSYMQVYRLQSERTTREILPEGVLSAQLERQVHSFVALPPFFQSKRNFPAYQCRYIFVIEHSLSEKSALSC